MSHDHPIKCHYPDCEPTGTGCLLGDIRSCDQKYIASSEADEHREAIRQGMQMALTLPNTSRFWEPLKMLCWKQPFASLMLPPWNKVETRTRIVNYRGLVLIVATEKEYTVNELNQLCGPERALLYHVMIDEGKGFKNGAAIGIGYLHACRHLKDIDKTYIKREHHTGRYGWFFKNVFTIEPIPMKGFQGWRNEDVELRHQIKILP